jgi:hypothetical protein
MTGTIAAGSEAFTCQYFAAPGAAKAFVVGASHTYTAGSHHMILFRTDLGAIPQGQEGPQDCYEGPAGSVMSHIRGILYAAQTPTGQVAYPDGVGLPVQPGEVFLMQTHYLDAGPASLDVRADVTLQLSDGGDVTTQAGMLFFYDPFIDVPPASTTARAQMRCLVPADVTLISAASHYHARGSDYAAYLDPPSGPPAATPFYTSNDWEHPTPLATPLAVGAGSRIRFSCGYTNPDPSKEYFQGQSAANDEMCMFVALYYPEMGSTVDFCRLDPDLFGTGTAGCGPTLACLQACAAQGAPLSMSLGDAPPDGGAGFDQATIDPCDQKCLVASCGPATAKLGAVRDCTRRSCAAECAAGQGSACSTCALANCASAIAACSSDTCAP